MIRLKSLKARQVLDSRGRPTVEVEARTSCGARGLAIVPSGASTGRHEALELRDRDPDHYGGLGVLKAVGHVETVIGPSLEGSDVEDQEGIDARLIELDGTPEKRRLGANAVLGVSLAVAHAAAAARAEELFLYLNRLWRNRVRPEEQDQIGVEPSLPLPMVNMISGGLHAGRNLDIQDVLVIPIAASSYRQALETIVAIYQAVAAALARRGLESALVGDEGGFGPKLERNEDAFTIVEEAIESCGLKPGSDAAIAVDVAATHFFETSTSTYHLRSTITGPLDRRRMVDLLVDWTQHHPIVSIEDGLAEDDWQGWSLLTERLGDSVQLIGDDLFTTQSERLRTGIQCRAANAILIKPNQVGTLSETLDTLLEARRGGYRPIISARSGETEDTTIADLAVATAAGQIKIGSVARSERLAKYNRLLRIEETLGATPRYAGRSALA